MPRTPPLPQKALDRLVQLHASGTPYREIAAVMSHECNHNFTRNAICGLVWRMNLPLRPQRVKKVRQRKPRAKPQNLQVQPLTLEVVEVRVVKHKPAGTYSIFDLTLSSCRYPTGNGPFLFCGAETSWPSSYCEEHTRLCFVKGSARHAPVTL